MKCEDLENMLSPLIDGELDEALGKECLLHIESCEKCRSLLEEHQKLDALIREIPVQAPPSMNLLNLVSVKKKTITRLAFTGALASLLCILCVLLSVRSLQERHEKRTEPEKSISYYVSLDDSSYKISVTGEEVKLLSFELSEHGKGSINMSFDETEHDKKEKNNEKNDTFIDSDDCALLRHRLPCRREKEA